MPVSKKIALLGDFAVGKTSLIRRYVLDQFSPDYQATLGVNVYKHAEAVSQDGATPVEMNMIIWDIESAEPNPEPFDSYLRGSAGAIVVADMTRPETIESLDRQTRRFLGVQPGRPIVFALNKLDLLAEPSAESSVEKLRVEFGAPLLYASAATGEGVSPLFETLARSILQSRV